MSAMNRKKAHSVLKNITKETNLNQGSRQHLQEENLRIREKKSPNGERKW